MSVSPSQNQSNSQPMDVDQLILRLNKGRKDPVTINFLQKFIKDEDRVLQNPELSQKIVRHICGINSVNYDNRSCLDSIIFRVVTVLGKSHAWFYDTIFIEAAQNHFQKSCAAMLQEGALNQAESQPKIRRSDVPGLLEIAAELNSTKILDYIKKTDLEYLEELFLQVHKGKDKNSEEKYSLYPLRLAFLRGSIEVLEWLTQESDTLISVMLDQNSSLFFSAEFSSLQWFAKQDLERFKKFLNTSEDDCNLLHKAAYKDDSLFFFEWLHENFSEETKNLIMQRSSTQPDVVEIAASAPPLFQWISTNYPEAVNRMYEDPSCHLMSRLLDDKAIKVLENFRATDVKKFQEQLLITLNSPVDNGRVKGTFLSVLLKCGEVSTLQWLLMNEKEILMECLLQKDQENRTTFRKSIIVADPILCVDYSKRGFEWLAKNFPEQLKRWLEKRIKEPEKLTSIMGYSQLSSLLKLVMEQQRSYFNMRLRTIFGTVLDWDNENFEQFIEILPEELAFDKLQLRIKKMLQSNVTKQQLTEEQLISIKLHIINPLFSKLGTVTVKELLKLVVEWNDSEVFSLLNLHHPDLFLKTLGQHSSQIFDSIAKEGAVDCFEWLCIHSKECIEEFIAYEFIAKTSHSLHWVLSKKDEFKRVFKKYFPNLSDLRSKKNELCSWITVALLTNPYFAKRSEWITWLVSDRSGFLEPSIEENLAKLREAFLVNPKSNAQIWGKINLEVILYYLEKIKDKTLVEDDPNGPIAKLEERFKLLFADENHMLLAALLPQLLAAPAVANYLLNSRAEKLAEMVSLQGMPPDTKRVFLPLLSPSGMVEAIDTLSNAEKNALLAASFSTNLIEGSVNALQAIKLCEENWLPKLNGTREEADTYMPMVARLYQALSFQTLAVAAGLDELQAGMMLALKAMYPVQQAVIIPQLKPKKLIPYLLSLPLVKQTEFLGMCTKDQKIKYLQECGPDKLNYDGELRLFSDKKAEIMSKIALLKNQGSNKTLNFTDETESIVIEILSLKNYINNLVKNKETVISRIFSRLSDPKEISPALSYLIEAKRAASIGTQIIDGLKELEGALEAFEKELGIKSERDAPKEFLCTISHEVMKHPVIAPDKQHYDRYEIQGWFDRGNTTSPYTRMPMTADFTDDLELAGRIEDWRKKKEENI